MNLQDQVVYRCIHAQCARLLPRKVNYCPYCGVSQQDGARAQPQAAVTAPPPMAPARPAAVGASAIEAPIEAPIEGSVTTDELVPTMSPHWVPPSSHAVPPPQAHVNASPMPPGNPAAHGIPLPRAPAAPPQRAPIRMRWWILALIGLWAIWMITKPDKQKIEKRVDSALALTRECKLSEAQGELIALRSGKASDEQVSRVQKAINTASPGCERKRVRARTWTETEVAVQKLIDDGQIAKAHARLTQFTRRHGEDDATRALKERIGPIPEPARPRSSSPASGELARDVLSARRLIDQAERDIQAGNYQGASDKMDTCVAMVDSGTRECAAFKIYADRLQAEMRRCLGNGMEWVNRRCQ